MRWVWVGLASAALGCAPVQVTAQATPATDFSRFATFAQAPAAGEEPTESEQVRQEIARVLEAKGYRAAPTGGADLVVACRIGGEERIRQKVAGDPDANDYVEQDVAVATLAIEVFEARGAASVWVGTGRSRAFRGGRAEQAAAGAVEEILAKIPAASGS